MGRIIGIDWGSKRVGIATTDPFQIIASPLETVETTLVLDFLKKYLSTEHVERFVIGEPRKLDGTDAEILPQIKAFAANLNKLFPEIPVSFQDERFTSSDAQRIIIASGIKKMKRRDKSLVDKISASIILEEYMQASKKW
jgi:putative Holliday junction resolvase